jgi:sulfoxide reductase heme-binding subunit YedZ
VTSLVRKHLGHKSWHRVHWLAYACWLVAVAHGLGIGTDRSATWVLVLSMACVLSVLAVATWRLVTSARLGVQ